MRNEARPVASMHELGIPLNHLVIEGTGYSNHRVVHILDVVEDLVVVLCSPHVGFIGLPKKIIKFTLCRDCLNFYLARRRNKLPPLEVEIVDGEVVLTGEQPVIMWNGSIEGVHVKPRES